MTPNTSRRFRNLIAGTAIVAGLLTTAAAPAWADDSDKAANQACWIEAETSATHCYADEDAMLADLIENYGGLPIVEGSAQARQAARGVASASTLYLIATLWTGTGYTGTPITVYATSSTWCANGGSTNKATMTAATDNNVSSVQSFFGCRSYLYDAANYGTLMGAYINSLDLGTASNRTSSYKIRA